MNKITDVAVIGGSLAGSFAAFLLGKIGHEVLIIEPNIIPQKKACGEGISLIGKRYLEKAGLWQGAIEKTAKPFYGFDIQISEHKRINLQSATPLGYSIHRRIIDLEVFNSAKTLPTVSVLQDQTRSFAYQKFSSFWKIENKNQTIYAKHLIVACGYFGRRLCAPSQNLTAGKERYGFIIRANGYWNNMASKNIIIKRQENTQLLLTPFFENKTNITVLVSKQREGARKISKERLVQMALEFAHQNGFETLNIEDCRGASMIEASLLYPIPEQAYVVGDTAEIFDPIGGMGMSHALLSASLAAQSIAETLENPKQAVTYWTKYNCFRKFYGLPFRIFSSLSYHLNVKQNLLLEKLLLKFPNFLQLGMQYTVRDLPLVGLVNNDQISSQVNYQINRKQAFSNLRTT